jgi:hypothetical protein
MEQPRHTVRAVRAPVPTNKETCRNAVHTWEPRSFASCPTNDLHFQNKTGKPGGLTCFGTGSRKPKAWVSNLSVAKVHTGYIELVRGPHVEK